jgi:hypothetical protein
MMRTLLRHRLLKLQFVYKVVFAYQPKFAFQPVLAETDRNRPEFGPRWNEGFLVSVYLPVREISAVSTETERN